MADREDLIALRRLAELEAKAGTGRATVPQRLAPVELSGTDKFLANLPDVPQSIQNVATGASGLMRGGANLISGDARLGDVVWPKAPGSEGTLGKTMGELADPVAWTVGGGILKALPYAKVLGSGLGGALKATAKNVAGGAAMGGAIGGLSDEGDAQSGMAVGAIANVALPPAVGAVTKAAGKVWDLLANRYGKVQAARIARAAAGGDLEAIKAATAAAPDDITAIQATSGVKNDVWDALGELAAKNDKTSFFARLMAKQDQARLDKLAVIAGGRNQTEARQVAEQSKTTLNQVTARMRETELAAANVSGTTGARLQSEADRLAGAASEKVDDVRRLSEAGQIAQDTAYSGRGRLGADSAQPAGMPRTGGQYNYGEELFNLAERVTQKSADDSLILGAGARFRQAQVDSLAAHGLKPIDTGTIVRNLDGALTEPTIAGNEVAETVIKRVSKAIRLWTERAGGTIDADALYALRKNAVNSVVDRLLGSADPTVKQKYASSMLERIKPLIDDAIIKAGGTGWRQYLSTYEQGMRQINRQQLGAKALELLQKTPQKYEELMSGNAPKVVEDVFGRQFDVKMAMGAKPYASMSGVASELARDRTLREAAARGQGGLQRLLDEHSLKFILPNWIDREIAVTNRILLAVESRLKKSTADALEAGMKSGKAASDLINTLPSGEKLIVLKAFLPYATSGGLNAAMQKQASEDRPNEPRGPGPSPAMLKSVRDRINATMPANPNTMPQRELRGGVRG